MNDPAEKKGERLRAVSPDEVISSGLWPMGRNSLYASLARGDIPGAVKIGNRWAIPSDFIQRLFAEREGSGDK